MIFLNRDEEEELENPDDEEATLAEDLLDEVGEEAVADDDLEGFGLLTPEIEKEDDEEEEEKDDEEEATLDEDAEDVDFDTFDDVDEM